MCSGRTWSAPFAMPSVTGCSRYSPTTHKTDYSDAYTAPDRISTPWAVESMWTRHVLEDGKIFRGSTREDIKAVFSDYEVLWANGCESVLNIPVRKQGVTIGSLNLLDGPGQYNDALIELAYVFAQLSVIPLEASRAALPLLDHDSGNLEAV